MLLPVQSHSKAEKEEATNGCRKGVGVKKRPFDYNTGADADKLRYT